MREITFDTETTGLSPDNGDRIVEIGCVELINKIRTGQHFHCYVNPERDVPKGAENVHGLSTAFLSDKPKFKDVVQEFIDFIQGDTLVIHNAAFDMKFINWELKNIKIPSLDFSRTVDTLQIARDKFPGAKANLDALCRRFGIDLSKRDNHGALLDAELLADVYIELLGGKQAVMLLGGEEKEDIVAKKRALFSSRKYLEARAFELSEEEALSHKEFLKGLQGGGCWF